MRFILLILLPLLLFTGCGSLQQKSSQPTNETAQLHAKKLAQLTHWQANGKLKITVDGQPDSASFSWQQFNNNYAINFFGPFGYGSSWLRRTSRGVTLESPEHPTQAAASPEQLLQDTVGWQAPISELQYWIKGQPAPGAILDQITTSPDGAVTQLRQQGWQIELTGQKRIGDYWLPTKIVATRTGIHVLIIVKEWSTH